MSTPAEHNRGSLAEHLDLMTDVAGRHRDSAAKGTGTKARYEGWVDAVAEIRAWVRENPGPAGQPAPGLVIRPGDKLVLGFPAKLEPSLVDRIKERVADKLPGVQVIVIDGVSQMAVYRAAGS